MYKIKDSVAKAVGFECSLEFTYRKDIKDILSQVDLVEIIPESYFFGRRPEFLKLLANKQIPIIGHSVDLSLGTDEPFKQTHFDRIRRTFEGLNCQVFSDHLCMTGASGIEIGQLTTLPFNEKVVGIVSRKIEQIQKQLDIPFMLENITNRFLIPGSELSETNFINKIIRNTGCGMLLDVTNTYINSVNHDFDPYEWIAELDQRSIMGIHLAGGVKEKKFMYDTHSRAVHPEVWELFKFVTQRASPKFTVVEWDQDAPSLRRLMKEVYKAKAILDAHPFKTNNIRKPTMEVIYA